MYIEETIGRKIISIYALVSRQKIVACMWATPTPANTPHASSELSPDHVVIELADADHSANGMPTLRLAPSVHRKLQRRVLSQRNPTAIVPGKGNTEKLASALDALNLLPNSFLAETPYRG